MIYSPLRVEWPVGTPQLAVGKYSSATGVDIDPPVAHSLLWELLDEIAASLRSSPVAHSLLWEILRPGGSTPPRRGCGRCCVSSLH